MLHWDPIIYWHREMESFHFDTSICVTLLAYLFISIFAWKYVCKRKCGRRKRLRDVWGMDAYLYYSILSGPGLCCEARVLSSGHYSQEESIVLKMRHSESSEVPLPNSDRTSMNLCCPPRGSSDPPGWRLAGTGQRELWGKEVGRQRGEVIFQWPSEECSVWTPW